MKIIGWILIVLGALEIIGVAASIAEGEKSRDVSPIVLLIVGLAFCTLGYWLVRPRGK